MVLVPPELDWVTATLWARPTVLAATGEELRALEASLAARPPAVLRSWRGPLRRLRALVVLDGGREACDDPASLWRRLGVRCVGARMISA